ncbi:hypothetical protein T4B_2013 [Trichinella pseudospiralis]|uniref:Uncharacterized protein n=1 Tax=Trichinella pseudospiralis TaxID=6337 RepID=A0A0V1EU85_TRIPS|nr:hypothetical protein T4A_5446 [Trichinella pseudospiralis]KRZ26700.1 hypothetical protein T4B_2013 [Trichinella pseudospiralis]
MVLVECSRGVLLSVLLCCPSELENAKTSSTAFRVFILLKQPSSNAGLIPLLSVFQLIEHCGLLKKTEELAEIVEIVMDAP